MHTFIDFIDGDLGIIENIKCTIRAAVHTLLVKVTFCHKLNYQ